MSSVKNVEEVRALLLKKRPVSIDFFAGIGGLSLGLELAGFFSAVHVEIEDITSRYAEYNFPLSHHFGGAQRGDIRRLKAKDVLAETRGAEVAVIAGGPPCQGFSTAGLRRTDDPLNDLVLEMARLVQQIQPQSFIIENVPGIQRGEYWQLDKALEKLSRDYEIAEPAVLYAPAFGVPQMRRRVFIVGIRSDLGKAPRLPSPTHTTEDTVSQLFPLKKTPTVADAIMDLPDCDAHAYLVDGDETSYTDEPHSPFAQLMRTQSLLGPRRGYLVGWDDTVCTNVRRTRHGADLVKRLAALEPDAADKQSRIKRLALGSVSTTIRAGTTAERGAWSAPRPCHPTLPRVLTTRECARLQSFPDWFRFHPAKWHGNRQVGNAVPPLLGEAVASALLASLGYEPHIDSSTPSVQRADQLIVDDIRDARESGLSRKKATHQVVNTDAKTRRRQRSLLAQIEAGSE